MKPEKNYEIRLKLVGEVKLVGASEHEGEEIDLASITADLGKVAEAEMSSADLRKKRTRNCVTFADMGEVVRYGMTKMLHVARDMELGKFRGDAFGAAVKNGVLSGGSVRGELTPELAAKLDDLGLRAPIPLRAKGRLH